MSLIISNKKTLNNTAIITIESDEKNISELNLGDLTIIKSGEKVVGLNVRNYDKYFKAQEGAHTLNDEQAKAIKKLGYEIKDYSSKFVVGKVLERKSHPKSDKLFLLRVQADRDLQIVTNAKNAEINRNVVVAKVGSTLPSGKAITLSKVMGIESEGMLCGGKTLGKHETEGVLIVKKEAGSLFII